MPRTYQTAASHVHPHTLANLLPPLHRHRHRFIKHEDEAASTHTLAQLSPSPASSHTGTKRHVCAPSLSCRPPLSHTTLRQPLARNACSPMCPRALTRARVSGAEGPAALGDSMLTPPPPPPPTAPPLPVRPPRHAMSSLSCHIRRTKKYIKMIHKYARTTHVCP